MLYPLKFKPVFKSYIWGGRNLEALNKTLPEGIVAESWELSCHPDGESIISNGEFAGISLSEYISKHGISAMGTNFSNKEQEKFPLLIKFIDANDKLSVQVHPEDEYAKLNENGELGKNEMWYIIDAKPGSKLVYDIMPGITKESLYKAIEEGTVQNCLKYVDVVPGDVLNIPAGLVHAIGEGIVIAEIQQNSNTTYRVYDYDRVDKNGNSRPLHINKALEVIDFNSCGRKEKCEGIEIKLTGQSSKCLKIANNYFAIEILEVFDRINELADGSKFFIYVALDGRGNITYANNNITIEKGDTIFIPASLGEYSLDGNLKLIKTFVPNLQSDIIDSLLSLGFTKDELFQKVEGLKPSVK